MHEPIKKVNIEQFIENWNKTFPLATLPPFRETVDKYSNHIKITLDDIKNVVAVEANLERQKEYEAKVYQQQYNQYMTLYKLIDDHSKGNMQRIYTIAFGGSIKQIIPTVTNKKYISRNKK